MKPSSFSAIPSVDGVLRELGDVDLPRAVIVAVVRRELAAIRADGTPAARAMQRVRAALDDLRRSRIQRVINATGVILHTNFGRAPLGPAVVERLSDIASHYTNLEYDLNRGARGGRAAYLEHNLVVLCGAAAATVVNNCAAALVLILRHFTSPQKAQVIISRGELIQIGGGFRVPEILEASGAHLREIGTTNKTTIDDYERAIDPQQTAMILKVHRSNFYLGGFTESPPTDAISRLARQHGVPFVEDLGSGAIMRTEEMGAGEHEPTPAEVLRQGVNLVCFSGDKLFGGPQAGIIAGQGDHVAALKKEPFFRALRCDKLVLSALEATVDLHLSEKSQELPPLAMMRASNEGLRQRTERIVAELSAPAGVVSVGRGEAQVGGGSLPRTVIESVTVDLEPTGVSVSELATRLRSATPPVIGYVAGGRFKLDLRTVFPDQDAQLVSALRQALA
jgi:L-seryl-tRNA(Ser) seleniumtransferase